MRHLIHDLRRLLAFAISNAMLKADELIMSNPYRRNCLGEDLRKAAILTGIGGIVGFLTQINGYSLGDRITLPELLVLLFVGIASEVLGLLLSSDIDCECSDASRSSSNAETTAKEGK